VKGIGKHLIVEMYDTPKDVCNYLLTNAPNIKGVCSDACLKANASIINEFFHKFPGSKSGVTGVIILEESHLSIHTWPEFNYIAIDIFTCGEKANPYIAIGHLQTVFQPSKTITKYIVRGDED